MPEEYLYFRWFHDHLAIDGLPKPDQIAVPDQSANRSGLGGRCWYVLISMPHSSVEIKWRDLCMGVLQMLARDIDYEVKVKETVFRFLAEHDPEDWNYFHCELRVFRNGVRLSKDESKRLRDKERSDFTEGKKWFRTEIAKRIQKAGEAPFPIPTIVSTASANKALVPTSNQSPK